MKAASRRKRVSFTPIYVDFHLAPNHPLSTKFVESINHWRKRNFPTAGIAATEFEKLGYIRVMANGPMENNLPEREISGTDVERRVRESHEFMEAFAKFVESFRAERK